MKVKVGCFLFDHSYYDWEGDVLYLHAGEPGEAAEFDETPEGHGLRFDAAGNLVGVTILNARWLLEDNERISLTLPERAVVIGERSLRRVLR
jgi:uncharacterized protein YuzE